MNSITAPKVGAYAKKQLGGLSFFLTWSHQARFRKAVKFSRKYKPHKLLDYGCGDGTFLYLLGSTIPERFGCDSNEKQIADCQSRLGSGVHFFPSTQMTESKYKRYFDLIYCMEVIEHCTTAQRFAIYKAAEESVATNGRIIFSMPIETGPSLLFKHLIRFILALRNVEHYKHREKYSFSEFFKMIFAGKRTAIVRPIYSEKDSAGVSREYHGHKGFNWKLIQEELHDRFEVEDVQFSPLGCTKGLLSSQVWIICKREIL